MSAYENGYDIGRAGWYTAEEANPYPEGTTSHIMWNDGFNQANQDAVEEEQMSDEDIDFYDICANRAEYAACSAAPEDDDIPF